MARSGARRKPRPTPKPPARSRSSSTRPAHHHEFSAAEAAMFFPRLRRQAKWVFVFLALTFGVGFVAFGVGSGGTGIGDIFQGLQSTSGPSVDSARKKIEKGDLSAYKELADAYRAQNKQDQAILAGERYVLEQPRDYEFMRALASDYEGKATKLREEAAVVQEELTSTTGGTTFALPQNTLLGRALGMGRIDRELTTAANQKLSELYSGIQASYTRATELYQRVAAAKPDDVLLQLLLAQSAYQAQNVPVAIKAYTRVIKLAPESVEADQARQQRKALRLQARAANLPTR